jgi:hypothetical protein
VKDQGFREVFGFDKLGLKQINDTLRALWKKVMGGLDWRDLAEPTQQVIDNKAERGELASLDSRVTNEAERLRNYAETIEAKADSGVDGVLRVEENLKLFSTTEQTEARIASEVLRVEGQTDEKLKNYSTVEQTDSKISQSVADIRQDLTRFSTVEQTEERISAVVAEVDGKLGGYASIDLMQDELALKVSSAAYQQDRVYRQAAAPEDPRIDMLWLDTSTSPNQLKRWSGEGWAVVNETDAGWRNYVQDSEYHELDSMGSYYTHWPLYRGLEQGVDYVLSVGSITPLRGSPTQVAVLLFDYDVNESGPRYLLNVSQELQQLHFVAPVRADRNWSLLIYNGLNGQTYGNILRFEHVKLEKGVRATAWTPAPEDPVTAVATGNGVTINRDGVFIDTNRFDLNLLGGNGETVLNMSAAGVGGFQQLRARRLEVADLYVAGKLWRHEADTIYYVDGSTGSDIESSGGSAAPYRTVAFALSQIPKCIVGRIKLYMMGDQTYSVPTVKGFYGPGGLTLTNWTQTKWRNSGSVLFERCACIIGVGNCIASSFKATECACVELYSDLATVTGTWTTSYNFVDCPIGMISDSEAYAEVGVSSNRSYVILQNVKGGPCGYSLFASIGGLITCGVARPIGPILEETGGKVITAAQETSGSQTPVTPPKPTETTQQFACSSMATWRTGDWRTDDSGKNRAVQAHFSGGASGNNVGCFFFDFTSLAGKTIRSATMRLTRYTNGGRSDAVTPYIGVHSLSSASGAPAPGAVSAMSPGLSWGESRSYDVTNQLKAIAATGGVGGLCLYDSGNSAGNYLVVVDKPTVTVTYL